MRSVGRRFLMAILALCAAAAPVMGQRDDDADLRGSVISAGSGEPVAGAWIGLQGWEFGTYSRKDGRFWLPHVPGFPARYQIDALGYLPSIAMFDPPAVDLLIELEPDAALLAGLTFLFDHLERRRRGGRVFDQEALAFSGAFDLQEFLAIRGVRGVRRLCVDEEWVPGPFGASPGNFYLLEIHGQTARLYTEEFLEQTAGEDTAAIQRIIRLYGSRC